MSTSAIGSNSYLSSLYSTSNKTSASQTSTSSGASTRGTGGLGESDFLNLLITQLKNQDPLNPMSDTDFIAQLANFSSLQQMTSVNTNTTNMLAAGMIGKQITTADGNSGVVSKVGIEQGTAYLYVGSSKYKQSDITSVSNATA